MGSHPYQEPLLQCTLSPFSRPAREKGNYFAEQRQFNLSLQANGINFDQFLKVRAAQPGDSAVPRSRGPPAAAAPPCPLHRLHVCLLYTSRCV